MHQMYLKELETPNLISQQFLFLFFVYQEQTIHHMKFLGMRAR